MGKGRTAEVKRDARIGEADAQRDAGIKVTLFIQLESLLSLLQSQLNQVPFTQNFTLLGKK